jgi:hypothetical protein
MAEAETMKEREESLEATWSRVRKKHFYPQLAQPTATDSMEGVALEIKSKQISLSREFIDQFTEHLPEETVIEALLDHGVTHYTYCPWDFHTYLDLYRESKKVFKDKEMARKSTEYFMDIAVDTHCYKTKDTPLPKLYTHMKRGLMEEVVHALYQRIWGEDLNAEGHEDVVRKLSRIPYLERREWPQSILRFSTVIQALLEEEKKSGNLEQPNQMGENDFGRYSSQEVDQGLKEFAASAGEPGRFREVIKDFEEELNDIEYFSKSGMGVGAGSDVDADLLYYMKLAENYSLPVRRTPIEKSGSEYPYGHLPWELGKPIQDIDPWTSFGKIMPGITQIWERREGETHGEEEDVPNCIVMIDSSGSMVNPKQYLSYAVLGAACASDAYVRNDAKVAVYNFSDVESGGCKILEYTRQRRDIYQTLCHYFGGGTRLNTKDVEAFQDKTNPDLFLITDMQITNLELLVEYLNSLPNRITAVHIGENDHVRRFKKSMSMRKNLSIFSIQKKEDIPRIVLGKVREYLAL